MSLKDIMVSEKRQVQKDIEVEGKMVVARDRGGDVE